MKLTWLTLDTWFEECEEKSFSTEYISQGNLYQFSLYLPHCIIQVKARWEES